MKHKQRTWLFLAVIVVLLMSCSLPQPISEQVRIFLHIPIEVEESDKLESWSEEMCNAQGSTGISLINFSEFIPDGEEGIECEFTYKVTNTGETPFQIVYYKQFSYGDNPQPNDYEFGWNKTRSIDPGETWLFGGSISDYPKQPLYVSMDYSIAFIYDLPQCDWITSDGIHKVILSIAQEEPIKAPCQLISPNRDAVEIPDLSEGLVNSP